VTAGHSSHSCRRRDAADISRSVVAEAYALILAVVSKPDVAGLARTASLHLTTPAQPARHVAPVVIVVQMREGTIHRAPRA